MCPPIAEGSSPGMGAIDSRSQCVPDGFARKTSDWWAPMPARHAVGNGKGHGSLGECSVTARDDAGHRRLFRLIGLEERTRWPLLDRAVELLGETPGQVRAGHDEEGRKRAGSAVLEAQHDATLETLGADDLLQARYRCRARRARRAARGLAPPFRRGTASSARERTTRRRSVRSESRGGSWPGHRAARGRARSRRSRGSERRTCPSARRARESSVARQRRPLR